jgi:hypothetical protein
LVHVKNSFDFTVGNSIQNDVMSFLLYAALNNVPNNIKDQLMEMSPNCATSNKAALKSETKA